MSARTAHEIDPVPGVRRADERVEHPDAEAADLVVVGAGPCGLAVAIAARTAGLRAIVIERGCLVSGIYGYPAFMTFFSTAERLSIGGVPFVVATDKPTRRDALAYYRTVAQHFALDVRQYETVEAVAPVEPVERGGTRRFRVRSRTRSGRLRTTNTPAVAIATGYFGRPNRLGVPGEELPHVSHLFREGHEGFALPVVVVGGGNSAVDAALELFRAGARVTIVHFAEGLDRNIKPWVLPDIANRMAEGSIAGCFQARVTAIEPDAVVVTSPRGEERVPAALVYTMLGYQPNNALLQQVGVPLDPASGIPAHDPTTMETAVPGIFIAGVLASGFDANKTFIENGRHHGELIVRHLASRRG